jgi:hypothetical protein
MQIDKFDIMAFAVLGTFAVIGFVAIVTLGSLPGKIAAKRGHPQANAINAASWISLATLGALWPLAFVWAFMHSKTKKKSTREEASK